MVIFEAGDLFWEMIMIELGSKAVDSITGFAGIVVAKHEYLHGCVRFSVESTVLKDGKPLLQTFDEQRLEAKSDASRGGPGDIPAPRHIP